MQVFKPNVIPLGIRNANIESERIDKVNMNKEEIRQLVRKLFIQVLMILTKLFVSFVSKIN